MTAHPSPAMLDLWRDGHRRLPAAGSALGVPLVRDGRTLVNAGRQDFLGFFDLEADDSWPSASEADLLVVHDLPEGGELATRLGARPGAFTRRLYDCPVLHFGGDPGDAVREELSGRSRRRLGRLRRKLEALGEVQLSWVPEAAMREAFERFFALLSERVADGREYDRNLLRRGFLRRLWTELGGRDLLVSVLTLDGVTVSYRSGFHHRDRFLGYMPVTDRALARYSVGNLHIQLLLPALAELGIRRYDFSKGGSAHKRSWANDSYALCLVAVPLRDSWRARARLAWLRRRALLRERIWASGGGHRLRRLRYRIYRTLHPAFRSRVRAVERRSVRCRPAPVAIDDRDREFHYQPCRYAALAALPLEARQALLEEIWQIDRGDAAPLLGVAGRRFRLKAEEGERALEWVCD